MATGPNTEPKPKKRFVFERLLRGSLDYFLCHLPLPMARFPAWILRLFYSGIHIDDSQTRTLHDLPASAAVVYVNKYKSYFEFLFYHNRYSRIDLKPPQIGTDYRLLLWQPLTHLLRTILAQLYHLVTRRRAMNPYESGFVKRHLQRGDALFLSLVTRRGFYRRFVKERTDPLEYLIHNREALERPVYLVPQLMFLGRRAQRLNLTLVDILFGTESHPGFLRRMVTMFRKPGRVFVEISEPIELEKFLQAPEIAELSEPDQARALRRTLLLALNKHRQSITGPLLKTPLELKESILTGDRLSKFMEDYAAKKNITIQRVHKKADAYLEEIAARYSNALISIGDVVLTRLFNIMFDGINVDQTGLDRAKAMSRRGPLIIIPCHKSHIDYLVMSYVMHHNNMPVPHIAAGKNLSFWPLGPIFRRGGAFFIRRTFRGALLYSKVFSEYIHKLLQEGFNIELFIEGGRSRTGKLLTPKLGFLSILLNAYRNGACDDLIFVPIFIGYDRILEENAYLQELEGGEKKPETLGQVLRARKFLMHRWGKIYIKFHEPIALSQLAAAQGKPFSEMTPKEVNSFCRKLGFRITNAIDNVSLVTPHALVAAALLNKNRDRMSYENLLSYIETYVNYLYNQRSALSDTLVLDQTASIDLVIESYLQRSFIERVSGSKSDPLSEAEFAVNVSKRTNLEYYKNNCIIFFVPPAFTALSILQYDAFQFAAGDIHSKYALLLDLFKLEFSWDMDQSAEVYVRKCLKAFIDDAILMPHPTLPDTYNLTSLGYRKLKRFAAFLTPFFEAYLVVLTVLGLYPKKNLSPKNRLKKVISKGNRMYKRKQVTRKEALSGINFKNALAYFNSRGISGSENSEKIEYYTRLIQDYLTILN